ncbi:MAG TPA: hypothetical protein VMZ33_05365, partial [Candidatus Limnocylindrales bacterium]|nr:hypothetical protein [Candidatus Limnocylindrales bacterium]
MLQRIPIDVPTLLSQLYKPLQPIVQRIHYVRRGDRRYEPADILLPRGYVAEVVCPGLTAPVHASFGPEGEMYVTESGHKSYSPPRVYRVDTGTGEKELVAEFGGDRWIESGAATGAVWHDGSLYVANTDTIVKIDPTTGAISDVVTGLPGKGDHQANHPLVGPEGKLYWGQGCVTNMGVVGADNFGYEWLPMFPETCDVPAEDIVLAGRNYEVPNVLGNPLEKATTGAYVPFGTDTDFGQIIPGNPKASGAILRVDPDTKEVEAVAWGLR